jgi:hypothetical protein
MQRQWPPLLLRNLSAHVADFFLFVWLLSAGQMDRMPRPEPAAMREAECYAAAFQVVVML